MVPPPAFNHFFKVRGDHFEISFESCFFICFLVFTLISYNLPFNLSNALIKKKVPYCIFFLKERFLEKKREQRFF